MNFAAVDVSIIVTRRCPLKTDYYWILVSSSLLSFTSANSQRIIIFLCSTSKLRAEIILKIIISLEGWYISSVVLTVSTYSLYQKVVE